MIKKKFLLIILFLVLSQTFVYAADNDPDVTSPQADTTYSGSFTVSYFLDDSPQMGTVKMTFSDGETDYIFTLQDGAFGSFTFDPTDTTSAFDVASATHDSIPSGTYTVTFSYTGFELGERSSVFENVSLDFTTETPIFSSPSSSSTVGDISFSYSLPETPKDGTVTLVFADEEESGITLNLGSDTFGAFSWDPTTDPAELSEVTSATASSLAEGTYTVTLSYQDEYENTAATAQATNVTIDKTPPSEITGSFSVSESASDGATVGTASSTDNLTILYSLTDDAGGRFEINSSTGVVTVADSSLLDYSSNTTHQITVRAMDSVGNTTTQNFTVSVIEDESESEDEGNNGGGSGGNTAPVVTAPDDLVVNATGLLTAVNLGEATVSDDNDSNLTATANRTGPFKPGSYTITWSATDSSDLSGSDSQSLKVRPMASFASTLYMEEGSSINVPVYLNGSAATYPVEVDFSVSGSATEESDYEIDDDSFIISSGKSSHIQITSLEDDSDEGDETIILTMTDLTNAVAGVKSSVRIIITDGNISPKASLSLKQDNVSSRLISKSDGNVTATCTATDANQDDVLTIDWVVSEGIGDNLSNNASLYVFDPSSMSVGSHSIECQVDDGQSSGFYASAKKDFRVLASRLELGDDDQDEDGINDEDEGQGDEDEDGIPDYLDAISEINILQEVALDDDTYLLETEPGLNLTLGSIAFQSGNDSASVSQSEILEIISDGVEDDYDFNGGLFDFNIDELSLPSQSVLIVMPQFAAIPEDAVYRKFISGVWYDFVEDDNNIIYSAEGSEGYCPPPGDDSYQEGLTEGHWCVQLLIEDGGLNDADGEVNQSISDPGGLVSTSSSGSSSSSASSGGGCQLNPEKKSSTNKVLIFLIGIGLGIFLVNRLKA